MSKIETGQALEIAFVFRIILTSKDALLQRVNLCSSESDAFQSNDLCLLRADLLKVISALLRIFVANRIDAQY